MSSSDEIAGSGVPVRTIHQTYRDSLQARSEYQQAIGTRMEGWAHQNLHDTVMDYFEVLRPLLSSMNATESLWEDEKLWPSGPAIIDVAYCASCGGHQPIDQLDESPIKIGELCPACENAVVETTRVPETDEDGVVVYEWVEGLQAIDELRNQRQDVEHTYSDALGTHTSRRTETKLLPPEQLTAIARKLDQAMKELKLHATADDKLPKGQISNSFDP